LLERFDEVKDSKHIHNDLITKEMLSMTSCNSALSGKYPKVVIICATMMIDEFKKEKELSSINDLF